MEPKRVVITGMGIISSVGNDLDTYWKNLVDGVCGIDYVEDFKDMPVTIAGKVKDFDPEQYDMDKAFVRKQDKFTQFAMAAAWQAMEASGLKTEGDDMNIDPFRLGVYVGSGIGGFEIQYRETAKMVEDPTGKWVSPLFIPTMISNIAAGHIAIASIPIGVAGFANAKALSRATDPKYASLPFNANRQGFVMGDGAAVLILESLDHALARGAKIYGEMVGYGNTCDAYHATAPRPDGSTQARAIQLALEEAGFDPEKDNLYINAHGTGTHLNDIAETIAYKVALGDYAYKAHISSIKSMTGHMFGAAGAAEAIATILALRDGIIPPTINLDCPDPECDLDYTPNVAVKSDITIGISDSLGFGGHDACVAFRKYSE